MELFNSFSNGNRFFISLPHPVPATDLEAHIRLWGATLPTDEGSGEDELHQVQIDVNGEDAGHSPLRCATRGGHLEVVKVLLHRGADPNLRDPEGNTALDLALEKNRSEIADLLKSRDERRNEHVQ